MIERANESDLNEILSLQKLSFQSEAELYQDYQIPPMIETFEEIKQEYTNQVILKECIGGKIAGSVRGFEIEPGVCYIGRLIVHPEHQNKGIGKTLIRSIEDCFSGCSKFSLTTGNRSLKNIHIYESLGYEITGEQKVSEILTLVHLEKNKS